MKLGQSGSWRSPRLSPVLYASYTDDIIIDDIIIINLMIRRQRRYDVSGDTTMTTYEILEFLSHSRKASAGTRPASQATTLTNLRLTIEVANTQVITFEKYKKSSQHNVRPEYQLGPAEKFRKSRKDEDDLTSQGRCKYCMHYIASTMTLLWFYTRACRYVQSSDYIRHFQVIRFTAQNLNLN